MLEKDAVETAQEMLAEGEPLNEIVMMLVRLEPRVRGKRTKYDPTWWDRHQPKPPESRLPTVRTARELSTSSAT